MRLIDADALTEEINSIRMTITGLRAGKGVLAEYAKHYRESVTRIIDEQPTVGRQDNWIPVSERLPEEPGKDLDPDDVLGYPEYIVTIEYAEKATTLFYLGEGNWYDEITENYYNVTAWIELPEAYSTVIRKVVMNV